MARTGENIYKRKDGRWEGRYVKERTGGKIKYGIVYARNYWEVKEKLDAARETLAKEQQLLPKGGTLAHIGELWLAEAVLTLKQSSVNRYEDILRCYLLPEFGGNDLSEITNQRLIGFANGLLSEGGAMKQGLSPATVAEILSVLNGIRLYAMRRDYAVSFSPECIRLKRDKREIRVFSLEEEEQLCHYLEENMDLTALGILLSLFTGLRVGELCAIRWEDISFSEKKLSVNKTVQRIRANGSLSVKTKVQIQEPKSACSIRTIPLPDLIMEPLEEFHVPGAFLLTGDGTRFMEPRTIQNRFKKILMSCGIPEANFHAIRHTFATRCIELGFDVKCLSEILGHASVTLTMNRYVHPTMAHKMENMNRFSNLFAVQ